MYIYRKYRTKNVYKKIVCLVKTHENVIKDNGEATKYVFFVNIGTYVSLINK